MIAPGSLNSVIIRIVQKLTGIFILINDPNKFTVKIIIKAINNDLNSHLKNFFIFSPIKVYGTKLFNITYSLKDLVLRNLSDQYLMG
jgi:hypothetical protein